MTLSPSTFFQAVKIKAGLFRKSQIVAGYEINSLRSLNLPVDYKFAQYAIHSNSQFPYIPPTLTKAVHEVSQSQKKDVTEAVKILGVKATGLDDLPTE